MDATALGGNKNVASITSNAAGVITIAYKPAVVPAGSNNLLLTPVGANGTTALDLSAAASAGSQVNWRCGGTAGTTVAAKFLPANCR